MDRVPPPIIHMHLRLLHVATEVPIGDLSSTNPAVMPPSRSNSEVGAASNGNASRSLHTEKGSNGVSELKTKPTVVEADVPEPERAVFDEWMRDLWRIKDTKLEEFHKAGAVLPEAGIEPGAAQVLDESKKGFASGAKPVEIPLRLRSIKDGLDAFCLFGPAAAVWMWTRLRT